MNSDMLPYISLCQLDYHIVYILPEQVLSYGKVVGGDLDYDAFSVMLNRCLQ